MAITPLVQEKKPDYICNFRAPSIKEYTEWQNYKAYVKSQGLDVCRVTIGLTNAFMAGVQGSTKVLGQQQNIQIQMSNQFLYQVEKPRREPFSLGCIKPEFRRTFSSILYEAFVLERARRISDEFSFRDFLEMDDRAFHRIVRRLIRKGEVVANPRRSVPRTYILTEKLREYGFKKI
jgi:hypothetical protein